MIDNYLVHVSHRSRFAVSAMVDIAAQKGRAHVRLRELAARHQVSLTFAEKVFSDLRTGALVKSVRGPHGGYCLARAADQIRVAEIVRAVPGTAQRDALSADLSAANGLEVDVRALFGNIEAVAFQFLEQVTLTSLAANYQPPPLPTPSKREDKTGIFQKPQRQALVGRVPNSVFAMAATLPI